MPKVFAAVPEASGVTVKFSSLQRDKYGHVQLMEIFAMRMGRAQSDRMDWGRFRKAVYKGAFDPAVFDEFDFPGSTQPRDALVAAILELLHESAERGQEAYGLPNGGDEAWTAASQTANYTNCLRNSAISGQ